MNENMNHTMGMLRKCQEEKGRVQSADKLIEQETISFVKEIAFKVDNAIAGFIEERVKEDDPTMSEYVFNINNIAEALKRDIPVEPIWLDKDLASGSMVAKLKVAVCPACKSDIVNHGHGWVCSNAKCRQAIKQKGEK